MIAYEPRRDITLNAHDLAGLCAHALHTRFYDPIQDYLEEQGLYFRVEGVSAARFIRAADDLDKTMETEVTPALYGGEDDPEQPDGVIIYNDKSSWAKRLLLFYNRVALDGQKRYNLYIPVRAGRWKLYHRAASDTPLLTIVDPLYLFATPDPYWKWELYLRGVK